MSGLRKAQLSPAPGGHAIPDLPGCIATAATLNELHQNIRAAVAMHFEGLRQDGLEVPEPQTQAESIGA